MHEHVADISPQRGMTLCVCFVNIVTKLKLKHYQMTRECTKLVLLYYTSEVICICLTEIRVHQKHHSINFLTGE